MRKPTKPGKDSEAKASGEPATPPARDVRRPEYEDAQILNEELEGAGDGKPMPDHDDDL